MSDFDRKLTECTKGIFPYNVIEHEDEKLIVITYPDFYKFAVKYSYSADGRLVKESICSI
jgi:hypothetical protein